MKMLFLVVLAVSLTASMSKADLAGDLVDNLTAMKAVYKAEYAPAAWKKQYANYDLDDQYNQAVASAHANPSLTIKDAHNILMNFVYAMKDYHTSISFVSTEAASLPFIVKGAGDKFFIVYIDRSKLSEDAFPFHVGDELVSVDGKPTGDVVSAIQSQVTENVPETDRALAELRLTNRAASRGLTVPSGPVNLAIKPNGSANVSQIQLIWDYTAENISPPTDLILGFDFAAGKGSRSTLFHPQMNVDLIDNSPSGETPYDLGSRKTFTPDLGAKIWESAASDFFYAYIFKNKDGKLIGYIRIASYEAPDYQRAVAEFAAVVDRFQNTTDAMIIDQANNPGGSVFYLYTLASMLTDVPLSTPKHRMSVTQADVDDALTAITKLKDIKTDDDARKVLSPADLDGFSPSYEFAQFMLNYSRFIVSEWTAGRKLTQPYWIAGVDHINPAKVHYSKPILLLTNHLDFSGGDFFPATLQDNKRVTIFGSRTAGAGGYVNDISLPNDIGVKAFRCTESIAERANGKPIENLGVTPDVPYEISEADLAQNYAPYVKAIQAAVSGLSK